MGRVTEYFWFITNRDYRLHENKVKVMAGMMTHLTVTKELRGLRKQHAAKKRRKKPSPSAGHLTNGEDVVS